MKYRDYEVEAILRERMPGYGRSVLMVVTAESTAAAEGAARREFVALTGPPLSIVESIEAAPILTTEEIKTIADDVLRGAAGQ